MTPKLHQKDGHECSSKKGHIWGIRKNTWYDPLDQVSNHKWLICTTKKVGPFPISASSRILPLTYCYNSGRSSVQNLLADDTVFTAWAKGKWSEMTDILMALVADNMSLDDVTLQAAPLSIENGRSITWASVVRLGSTASWARTLLSQGLYVKMGW